MRIYPNAKINIGLSVTERRTDGYHNLETVFYPVGLRDVLELNREEGPKRVCYFENTGIAIDCPEDKNLVVRAYKLLASAYDLPAVRINLFKTIPFGAGLGGGSSDAAYTLKALNEYFELRISEKGLENYASRLGSDCAFFIRNRPAFASGKGDVLEDMALELDEYEIVIVKPDCKVSTAEAYAGISPAKAVFNLRELNLLPLTAWRKQVKNDFETTVFAKYPAIRKVKEELYNRGALYASMTGSGAGVFGIFPKGDVVLDTLQGNIIWRTDRSVE
ncbi:4-(cytidine 5'-diphospho)-2-C-methyl-D-erythritol kinase [Odoribacter laneus]|uniref:4-(cytidine 5'-diphospho)-2-C-methyl-D-erythritol kinase n=1 Tax=Odoribacter laneus TaxID=626933 RepID=UPI0003357A46|nr:4-(cytidine 5'-diphospho)-2-C-methyl-D-erythritol kinase [Odoribacter laneus]CCZ81424.1 4-diphosphocytidyl-2-C-methyl-D-erythritol kinase [Odoribacter laneus CAG:561]